MKSPSRNETLQKELHNIANEAGLDPEQLKRLGLWENFERGVAATIERCLSCAQSHSSQIDDYRAGIDSVRDGILETFGINT